MVKNFSGIFLVILVLSGTFRETTIYISFKLNQKYIAENLCVNKDKPVSSCGGSCYLKEQLEKSQEKEMESPMPKYEYNHPIQFINNSSNEDQLFFNSLNKKEYSQILINFHIDKHTSEIFVPPKC